MEAQGVVIVSIANLYRHPSTAVEVVSQAILGTSVSIAESQNGWYHVGTPDQYRGWVEAGQVRPYSQDQAPYATLGKVAEVKNLFALLYEEPDVTSRAPVWRAAIGARLEVAGEQESWFQIGLPDGSAAWVAKGAVTLVEAGAQRSRGSAQVVIQTAKRFLGLPYQWGGTTPLGLDCSGFVQLVYGLHGVSLLRDANIQYTQPGLPEVERQDLQAGDLIFFGQTGITHVGLYMGDGHFIHATTHLSPEVQISRLDEAHWTALYRGARRP